MLVRPDNWTFYNKAAGKLEIRDTAKKKTGNEENPLIENQKNLTKDY